MKFIKQDLLTLLISLFILSGCSNPDGVGLEVDPDYSINGHLIDTATIHTVTVREDSVVTSGLSKYPLGYMNDPVFGSTESNIALNFTLPEDNVSFGTNPVLDSAVLVLKYADFYGDSLNTSYQINVHRLDLRLLSNTYFNTTNFSYSSDLLGAKSLTRIKLKDSVRVQDIKKGQADAEKRVAPQIRIPLNADFVRNNIVNTASANLGSTAAFNQFLRGLYVTIDKAQTVGSGGIMFFDLATDGASALEIYYRSESGTAIDTAMKSFKILSGSAPVVASFNHNYAGTAIETQLNSPNQSYTSSYVQGLAGLKTKVRFPYLTNLKALGKVTINKAELVVDVEGAGVPFTPVPRLFLYRTDIAGQKQLLPDLTDSDFRSIPDLQFGGFYNNTAKRYVFSVTSYVQDIISGRMKQYDAFLSPVDLTTDKFSAVTPNANVAARSILGGFANPNVKMKLNIIYTTANQ